MCLRYTSGMSFQHTETKRGRERDKQKQKKHYHCFAKDKNFMFQEATRKIATKTMQTPPVASLCPSPSKPSNSPWTFIGPTCNHTPESHKLHAIKLQYPKFPMSKNIKWPEANHTDWNSNLYDQDWSGINNQTRQRNMNHQEKQTNLPNIWVEKNTWRSAIFTKNGGIPPGPFPWPSPMPSHSSTGFWEEQWRNGTREEEFHKRRAGGVM